MAPGDRAGEVIRLTMFRRGGAAVSTPVWFVVDADALLVTTMDSTGKPEPLRHSPRVTLCVCDRRGNVNSPEYDGTAELLPGDAAADVRQQVMKRYGYGYGYGTRSESGSSVPSRRPRSELNRAVRSIAAP